MKFSWPNWKKLRIGIEKAIVAKNNETIINIRMKNYSRNKMQS